jgi:hypothetical protein
MSEISFFSESDMVVTKEGKKIISSEYPIWYNRQMLDEISEDVRMAEFDIKSGRIRDEKLSQAKDRLNNLKEKMAEIEASIPKLESKDVDRMSRVRKELAKEIASKMFSRSDMKKGLADSHEEARRMSNPSISLSPDAHEFAKACNVNVVGGKVSRMGAEKIWKITGRFLDETSNTEYLRKD